jgi:hypothetical protein
LSVFSESGEADGTRGERSESPRYLVVRSIPKFDLRQKYDRQSNRFEGGKKPIWFVRLKVYSGHLDQAPFAGKADTHRSVCLRLVSE